MIRRHLHTDSARRKQWYLHSSCGFYAVIYTSNQISKHVLTVALTTHRAMSLRHKLDENMKGDSKLLITEATLGFLNSGLISNFATKRCNISQRTISTFLLPYELECSNLIILSFSDFNCNKPCIKIFHGSLYIYLLSFSLFLYSFFGTCLLYTSPSPRD